MPIITMTLASATEDQKKELISQITEVSKEITKIPAESFHVLIQELEPENIGIGGKSLKRILSEKA